MAFRFRSKGYDLTCAGRSGAHETKGEVVTVDFKSNGAQHELGEVLCAWKRWEVGLV